MNFTELGRTLVILYGIWWAIRFTVIARRLARRNGARILGLDAEGRLPLVQGIVWLSWGIALLWVGLWIMPHPYNVWLSRVGIVVITLPLLMRSATFWERILRADPNNGSGNG